MTIIKYKRIFGNKSGGGGGSASDTSFTPNGDIAATTVQNAIVEVRDDSDTKLALKQNFPLREAMVDADTVFSLNKTEVYLSTVLTAPRILTLPAANAFVAGTELIFLDEIGGVTGINTVTITRAGTDTINGTTTYTSSITNGIVKLVTDGTSKWTANQQTVYSTGTYVPTFSGFSVDPSGVTARYILIGKLCFIHVFPASAGTSNATTFTITLPFAAANTSVNYSSQVVINNNVQQAGRLMLTANSNIGTMQLVSGAAWTALGVKTAFLMMTYEIA